MERDIITATHWGIVRAHVSDGRLVSVRPFEKDEAPSPNLDRLLALPYSPSRILHPMVREGFLERGPASRDRRGGEKFVRVSWDEALDLAAREINRVYDTYGASAVFGRSYGWMSAGKINSAVTLVRRLLNLRGGFLECVNSYSTAAVSKILPYVVGTGDPRSTCWEVVLEHAERIVFWGADPVVTNDVDWFTTVHPYARYLREVKEKGIPTIAVNPLRPETADRLGSRWIAPRPGTDCALMLGMIHELVSSGRAATGFLETRCAGWPEFLAYVMGGEDGVEKTPVWAARETGIPEAEIVALTHELADHRTMIMMGWGIQRIQYGEQPHWMGFALAAALGQIGLPGGGIGTNYHYSSGGAPKATGPFLGGISGAVEPVVPAACPWQGSRVIPVARFVDCFENPGKTIDFNGTKVTYPDIRLVMWAGGNPFAHQPDTMRLERAWRRPEVVIVTDSVWTATARHADIVLPAATVFEHDDITNVGCYTNEGIVAMQRAIDPVGEARSDYSIFSELAKRIGVEAAFTEGLDEAGWIRRTWDEAADRAKAMGVPLPAFDDFLAKGDHWFPVREADRRYVAFADFREDPQAHPLKTESGLIQLWSPKIAGYNYPDCPGHPTYLPASEGLNTRTDPEELALLCVKSRRRLHSQLDGAKPGAAASEPIPPREPCWISPADAEKRGIATGDIVLVENRRGALLSEALVTDRVMPGVVCVHHGGWFDPRNLGGRRIDVHGNANTLTMDVPTSALACGNIASTALVRVSRWTEPDPGVAVHNALEVTETDLKPSPDCTQSY
ncbi:molybdopterin-dependent oxidoreductase [Sutterella sp.]|uniref:molybdopterin-dependent oxidoreductase n=1 Tax=Sutterella sp. TaxID=1981025 RepID=UPI0026DF1A2A|nr:molybdopterin-dependent oxidoreductase [Sutterella sp.]MDO5532775.1 molybdopterin-dependent oxidoreductase [Sutterella sp.]